MIVEQLANKKTLATNLSHNFTEVVENVIYYISGYVINKLLYQYKTHSGEAKEYLVKVTLGDNNDTYLDYVKVRTTKTDCGGLKHVFDDIFRFCKAL